MSFTLTQIYFRPKLRGGNARTWSPFRVTKRFPSTTWVIERRRSLRRRDSNLRHTSRAPILNGGSFIGSQTVRRKSFRYFQWFWNDKWNCEPLWSISPQTRDTDLGSTLFSSSYFHGKAVGMGLWTHLKHRSKEERTLEITFSMSTRIISTFNRTHGTCLY